MSADDLVLTGVTNTGREVAAPFDLRALADLQEGRARIIAATGPVRDLAEERRLDQGSRVARLDQLASELSLPAHPRPKGQTP